MSKTHHWKTPAGVDDLHGSRHCPGGLVWQIFTNYVHISHLGILSKCWFGLSLGGLWLCISCNSQVMLVLVHDGPSEYGSHTYDSLNRPTTGLTLPLNICFPPNPTNTPFPECYQVTVASYARMLVGSVIQWEGYLRGTWQRLLQMLGQWFQAIKAWPLRGKASKQTYECSRNKLQNNRSKWGMKWPNSGKLCKIENHHGNQALWKPLKGGPADKLLGTWRQTWDTWLKWDLKKKQELK